MKHSSTLTLALLAAGFTFNAGCSKPEQPAATPAAVQPVAEQGRAEVIKATTPARIDPQVQAQVDNLRKETEKPAATVTDAAASLTSTTQAAIDNVKKLLAENKWSDALQALNNLAAEKLTPNQQTAIETLKQQAQKFAQQAASSTAAEKGAKAIGDQLPKK